MSGSIQILRKEKLSFGFKLRNLFTIKNIYGLWIPEENSEEVFMQTLEHLKTKADTYVIDADRMHENRLTPIEIEYLKTANKEDKELKLNQIKKEIFNGIRYHYNDKKKIIFLARSLITLQKLVGRKNSRIIVLRNELDNHNELDRYLKIPYKVITYDRTEKLLVALDLVYTMKPKK